MTRYREEAEKEAIDKSKKSGGANSIETIQKACPICNSDVKGDDEHLYFCKQCSILFKRHELAMTEERIEDTMKKRLAEKYAGELDIARTKIPLKKISAASRKRLKKSSRKKDSKSKSSLQEQEIPEISPPSRFIVSKASNILHVYNCPFAQNISESNRMTFDSIPKGKGYKRCKCMMQ